MVVVFCYWLVVGSQANTEKLTLSNDALMTDLTIGCQQGEIRINFKTGNVVLSAGCNPTTAGREFWEKVIKAYPELKEDMCD